MVQRDFYIDRLRSVMTAMVILHHTAITYGAPGGWFWTELRPSGSLSSVLLTLFVSTNQAYFMGFFFLLAGYFTPPSLERKGYKRFLCDRFLRLGLPLLAFGLVLGPLTAAIVTAARGDGFWPTIEVLWQRKDFINGPLWFAEALLIFDLGYCGLRAVFGPSPGDTRRRKLRPVPGPGMWLLSALAIGAAALAIRQFVPVGKNVFGLQLGYFAGYIFLFAVGIAAARSDWLRKLTWKTARPALFVALFAWPTMPLAILYVVSTNAGAKSNFSGGLTWPAVLYAFWEPVVAWGLIAAWLLIFREYMNRPSRFWDWLNRRAYAVYIIHPPVLVAIALLLHVWTAPAMLKFAVVGALACVASWLWSDPLVRLPGVRRVV
jgi:peptidoglycan/LPS O-acetylase OafA/YrhL